MPVSGGIWTAIALLIDTAKPISPTALAPNNPTKNAFLQELNAVLQQDRYFCSEELSRDTVCRCMHTNRTTFSKKLQEATDMTFSEYLREMRLQEAAR